MPVPIILAGIAITTGIVGVGGHMAAKDTNEEAKSIADEAKKLYDDEMAVLEEKKNTTEKALSSLGYNKKKVLDTSLKQFAKAYKRFKNIEITNSIGLNELNMFSVGPQDVLAIENMTSVYESAFKSGAAGAATGAAIALASSGTLSIVTSGMALSGSALMAGEVGAAAGLAGSTLALGASMTPLVAVAAPVVLFTGISASLKADENLEKAIKMRAESELAVEKMKTAEILCEAIGKRSEMFNDLLNQLNKRFAYCANELDIMTKKKKGFWGLKSIDVNKLTPQELQLIAVSRALAGAVKAVIDVPILNGKGEITDESLEIYDDVGASISRFDYEVENMSQLPNTVVHNAKTVNPTPHNYSNNVYGRGMNPKHISNQTRQDYYQNGQNMVGYSRSGTTPQGEKQKSLLNPSDLMIVSEAGQWNLLDQCIGEYFWFVIGEKNSYYRTTRGIHVDSSLIDVMKVYSDVGPIIENNYQCYADDLYLWSHGANGIEDVLMQCKSRVKYTMRLNNGNEWYLSFYFDEYSKVKMIGYIKKR